MTAFEPWRPERGEAVIAGCAGLDGAALPMFHALQDAFGYVPREAVAMIADTLNLSRAEVYGALSFYHDFRHAPPGARMVKVCRAESCQAMGGEAAGRFLLADLGIGWGETTPDGAVTVDAVYCLGLCAVSPAALVDGEPLGRIDGVSLVEAARA
jgi:formate dehydrogenase subunit gamma